MCPLLIEEDRWKTAESQCQNLDISYQFNTKAHSKPIYPHSLALPQRRVLHTAIVISEQRREKKRVGQTIVSVYLKFTFFLHRRLQI